MAIGWHFGGIDTSVGGELFEFNTPDCVSSFGRRPTEDSFVHWESPIVEADGKLQFENPVVRWPGPDEFATYDPRDAEVTAKSIGEIRGRGVVGVFGEAWNATPGAANILSTDWIMTNVTLAHGDRTFKGHRFAVVTSSVAGGFTNSNNIVSDSAENHIQPWSIVLARGETDTRVAIRDTTAAANRMSVDVDFDTKTVTVNTGTLVYERWYGDDVVELGGWTTALVTSTTNILVWDIFPSAAATGTVEVMMPTFTYQQNDYFAPLPFRGYGTGRGRLVYPYRQWQDKGTLEFWFLPMFGYQIPAAHNPILIDNRRSAAPTVDFILLEYDGTNDRFQLTVQDNATDNIVVVGPTISAEADLHKWTHFLITWDADNNLATLEIDGVAGTPTTNGAGITGVIFLSNTWLGVLTDTSDSNFYAASEQVGQGYITDLRIRNGVTETAATTGHFSNGRPWCSPNRLLGRNSQWKVDEFGTFFSGGGTLT